MAFNPCCLLFILPRCVLLLNKTNTKTVSSQISEIIIIKTNQINARKTTHSNFSGGEENAWGCFMLIVLAGFFLIFCNGFILSSSKWILMSWKNCCNYLPKSAADEISQVLSPKSYFLKWALPLLLLSHLWSLIKHDLKN